MKTRLFAVLLTVSLGAVTAFSQGTPPPSGPPRGEGPRKGQPPPEGRPHDDWMKRLDSNGDGKLDAAELKASMDTSFKAWDRNENGVLEAEEMPRPPRGPKPPNGPGIGRGEGNGISGGSRPPGPPSGQQGMPLKSDGTPGQPSARPQGPPPGFDGGIMLPPFFFADRNVEGGSTSRADRGHRGRR